GRRCAPAPRQGCGRWSPARRTEDLCVSGQNARIREPCSHFRQVPAAHESVVGIQRILRIRPEAEGPPGRTGVYLTVPNGSGTAPWVALVQEFWTDQPYLLVVRCGGHRSGMSPSPATRTRTRTPRPLVRG